MNSSAPQVDTKSNTVSHQGKTFVMRPLSEDSYTVLVEGIPVGRIVYVFGAANAVVENESVSEDVLTEIAEAWFDAVGA